MLLSAVDLVEIIYYIDLINYYASIGWYLGLAVVYHIIIPIMNMADYIDLFNYYASIG